jgi:hypothetical protein
VDPDREEDQWADATDPTTGFVFHVDSTPFPRPLPNGSAIPPSTSSSSLSSSTSFTRSQPPIPSLTSSPLPHCNHHSFSTSLPPTPNEAYFLPTFPPPRSVTPQYSKRTYSMYEIGSSNQPSPVPSEDVDGCFTSERGVIAEYPSPCPSPSPSEGRLPKYNSTSAVGQSSKRRWRSWRKRGSKRSRNPSDFSKRMVPSDSVPNLTREADYEDELVSLQGQAPPHGEVYGSRGFPLVSDSHGSIISVRIPLKPHPQAARPHRHMNLEKLGIIPARALKRRRYRSLTSLRFSFKNYPPSPSSPTNSLVIRGIIPASLASLTSQLQPGDTILAVNGHSVNLDNANSIIRTASEDELVLIVKKSSHHSSTLTSTPAHHHLHTPSHQSGLVRLVSGKRPSHRHHSHPSPPHLLMYLTLDTNEEDPANKVSDITSL